MAREFFAINHAGRHGEPDEDIARVTLCTTQSLVYDSYQRNCNTGSLILIDESKNTTVDAWMIV